MGVISLSDYREKKKKKREEESRTTGIKQEMRDSLDNGQVMRRYGIAEPSTEERMERIKKSIDRVNQLMSQLRDTTEGKK